MIWDPLCVTVFFRPAMTWCGQKLTEVQPSFEVPHLLKTHGDTKAFELCQVRLDTKGVTLQDQIKV